MVVRFEKCELKIDQIHKEEFSQESFVEHEIKVIELISGWLKNESYFEFKTSGSTGKAKTIRIERKKIEYSCKTTMERLDPDHKFDSVLLCINPEMIGGAMVVFRALLWGMNLHVIKPSSNPFEALSQSSFYDLVSLVPLQFQNATAGELNRFRTILIGGGHYSSDVPGGVTAQIYATFGMTETVSHFALRPIDQEIYECLGDVEIKNRPDNKLAIKGTLTNHKSLIINDIIEFTSTKKFKWIGRSDFVINSGGIKINPEEIESKLSTLIDRNFIISYIDDEALGNKVILVIEGLPFDLDIDFSELERFQKPKEVFFLENFVFTPSQKIDRFKTRELLLR